MPSSWTGQYQSPTGVSPTRRHLQIVMWFVAALPAISLSQQASIRQPNVLREPIATQKAESRATIDDVEAIRKQANESSELDAEAKQKIEANCLQALDGLKKAAELVLLAEQHKRDADDVGQRVDILRRHMTNVQTDRPALAVPETLPELEQEVARREAALAELKAGHLKSEAEPGIRANRRREIREQLLSATQRIADIQKQLDTAPPSDETPLLTKSRRMALLVNRAVLESEQPAFQNELSKYDAEDAADWLRLRRDVRSGEVSAASTDLEKLQGVLSRRRAADSAEALHRARMLIEATPNPLHPHVEEIIALAEAAHALTQPIDQTTRQLEGTTSRLEDLRKQFATTEQRVREIGLTGSIGAMLRRQRAELPDLRRRRKNVHDRKTLIEDTQFLLLEYDDQRDESVELATQRIIDSTGKNANRKQKDTEIARAIAEKRQEYLDTAIRAYNTYLDALFDLDSTEQRLIRETEQYQGFIDERVLWIRSNRTLFSTFEIDPTDGWVFDQAHWRITGDLLVEDASAHSFIYSAALLIFLVLLNRKRPLLANLEKVSQTAKRGSCTEFSPTLRASLITVAISVAWPGVILFLSWRLAICSNGQPFVRALSQSMFVVASVFLPLELLRRVCRAGGLAECHFDWSTSGISFFRTNLKWPTLWGLVIVFSTTLLYASDPEHGTDSVERVLFAVGMVTLAIVVGRAMRPGSGLFREYLALHPGGWFDRLKGVVYWTSITVPLSVAGLTVAGYYYTSQQLTWRFYVSFVFVFGLQLLRAFLRRLLLVRRRALSIEQGRLRRATQAESIELTPPAGPTQVVPAEDNHATVTENTEQTQRLIRTCLVAATLVGLWVIWVDVLPALRILDRWPVWTTQVDAIAASGSTEPATAASSTAIAAEQATQPATLLRVVTMADIGFAILIGIVTCICARNIPGLMEISILQRLPLDNSIRYAVTTVTSYLIVLLGVILAFNAISVGWSKVQWLATALTFGLAFGLQEIFANFIAGLILLFERPLRVGDVVTVDEVTGVVSRIRIRATTITNWDRKEYVIPNKEFITGRMLNWTLSDKTNRIVINVGVSYTADVETAKELLANACQSHPLVMDDPPTRVTFESFGDNSLNLVIRTFLPDLDNRLAVVDELHSRIHRAFREAGIEIAFPQRDLHLRTVDRSMLNIVDREGDRKSA